MINLYKQDGDVLYGVKEFLLDSQDDVVNLPTNIKTGSTALVIPTGTLYMLNGHSQWIEVGGAGGNASSGSSEEKIAKFDANNNDLVDSLELHKF